jgi:Ni2+-binding GTPase involved in maturation of urease and hydrogenase
MATARYLMIGGFLGAGKTTAILKLAEHLDARGRRVGLITNDQSVGLVDTTMLASHGFPVAEITGGCFCCRFNSLIDAAARLAEDARPEVFIAEPVGSCTDLRASVSYPLRQMYGQSYSIAPLSVLVDPVRALRVLGVEPGRSFTSKVLYVYRKQLEEAAIIVINKCDTVSPERIAALRAALSAEYPKARLFEVSARTGHGLEDWFDAIVEAPLVADADLDIDYQIYGEGEALLGWLNATVRLDGASFDGNVWLRDLASRVQSGLDAHGVEIAHLKMTLSPGDEGGDLAVLNQVRSEQSAELSHQLMDDVDGGALIVNLRAEGDPDLLSTVVARALAETAAAHAVTHRVEHEEHFRPGQPNPTHRLVVR